MTTYQVWVNKGKQEGRHEGEHSKARLVVLRGKWRGASVDFLADQSELPYQEVADMLNDYNEVYQFWSNKKGNKKALLEVAHLSEQEVRYLMNLFAEKQN